MFFIEKNEFTIPLHLVTEAQWTETKLQLAAGRLNWLELQGFKGKAGQFVLMPDDEGHVAEVWVGFDSSEGYTWALGQLPSQLPSGEYALSGDWLEDQVEQLALGWGLGSYRFEQFRKPDTKISPLLHLPEQHQERVRAIVEAIHWVRNLVNTPANHMMPYDLEQAMSRLAEVHEAQFRSIVGQSLLTQNFPAIHAVGRASVHAPRLLELNWGDESDPRVCLVGKGVCFDTGGLDIKPSSAMRLMKKDMGGAAHVLGLAKLIMQLELPVRLQVLVPAVDNAIGGDAFRPGDVLSTRLGKTVEVDNTDAEGRLILCDTLAYAVESDPEVIIDFATLTGAARIALGTEIPVFFTNDRSLMQQLQAAATRCNELIWNLPLHKPYFEKLKSSVADLSNSGDSYGGAITAALFLNEFVPAQVPWAHFDVMAWNLRARPGRPIGGEAMGLLAVFNYLEMNFAAD
ncbi:leucyl aminopeptidase family protein [Thiolinea disciformis]|uniref:leucyl aminopeptidase family protein n=1 Tax=Thiolinea disciformis TaxID=125614 RepID=UPI00036A8210|nr:leucyl aminopeptidase family protein [Thiolinea disciformis]